MNKPVISILDSGISPVAGCYKNVFKEYCVIKNNNKINIIEKQAKDEFGHGTAIANIIYKENQKAIFVIFKLCSENLEITEQKLIFALNYIYENIETDFINISLGITYISDYHEMVNICNKLNEKGILLISAFDNDKAISYPAAFKTVIGVDTEDEFENKSDFFYCNNSIINIFVPNVFYRTEWLGKNKVIIKGTSFAAAKITGVISNICSKTDDKIKFNYEDFCVRNIKFKDYEEIKKPSFKINKAIVFPYNKESHALLRFNDMLQFEITNVYDDKLSGKTGKEFYGKTIKSFDEIEWDSDFDTVILSCNSDLTKLTKRNYKDEILIQAVKNNKNIYSFEKIEYKQNNIYFPTVTENNLPYGNNNKLHHITMPVVGVFGTSSKQGKYTLQLEIIKKLKSAGYNTGHLATEASGYLFNSDFVFHFGYGSEIKLSPWQYIMCLNEMMWQIQIEKKDIAITGCQSSTLNYEYSNIEDINILQHSFIIGTMPDFCILCINPHDDNDYILRTINYISSITDGKVKAIAVFPIKATEINNGLSFKEEIINNDEMQIIKIEIKNIFNINTYEIGNTKDIEMLCEQIIEYFTKED